MTLGNVTGKPFPRPWDLLLILLAGLMIYCWRLGDSPLDRTEPHRALVAHQMVLSHQWMLPRLFGEVYLRKPPLIYWTEGLAEKIAGHGSETIWRLPSALGSTLLAVALAVWAGRWFGPTARLPAGIACLALIPLWEQDRGADIDALNTLLSVLTAMMVIDITVNEKKTIPGTVFSLPRRVGSAVLLTLLLGATLLLKGPGGLPPILGALLGPSLVLKGWRRLAQPVLWVGMMGGVAIAAVYSVLAKAEIYRLGITTDSAGLHEALQRMVLHDVHSILPALGAPIVTLAYALPVSLVIVVAIRRCGQPNGKSDPACRLSWALLATLAVGFVLFFAAGNPNPRYEYVMLPLLAPLVGAMAAQWFAFSPDEKTIVGWLLAGMTVVLALVGTVITAMLFKRMGSHIDLLIACAIGWISAVAVLINVKRRTFRFLAVTVLFVLMTVSVPLSERKNLERRQKSAQAVALELRSITRGEPVNVASMIRDMPEMFYYADIPVKAFGEWGIARLAAQPGGHWVVLSQNPVFPEYGLVTAQIPDAFPIGVHRLHMPSPADVVYVGWYNPPGDRALVVKAGRDDSNEGE